MRLHAEKTYVAPTAALRLLVKDVDLLLHKGHGLAIAVSVDWSESAQGKSLATAIQE